MSLSVLGVLKKNAEEKTSHQRTSTSILQGQAW